MKERETLRVRGLPISFSHQKDNLKNLAWRSLADTYKTVYFYINSDLRQYGLTVPQYAVLRNLGLAPGLRLSMSDIGKALIVTFANITTIVDNLEKRGYVKRIRDQIDRRVVNVELTSSGLSLFRKIYASHRIRIAKLMKALSSAELKELISYTTKIRNMLSQKNNR